MTKPHFFSTASFLPVFLFSFFLFVSGAHAQKEESSRGLFDGARTQAGFGFSNYNVTSPGGFELNSGLFFYLGGELPLNEEGLSFTATFNYITADGSTDYSYTSGATQYTGSDVDFAMNTYQLTVGLRQRFYLSTWLRPYIEGGGLFGYHQLEYNGNLSNITGTGGATDFKKKESLSGLGFYAEAGSEIDFGENFGTRLGIRYQNTKTKEFETLGNRSLEFNNILFIFSLLLRF